ncbi:hypothetical protein [Spirosoma sp.]|uniref:hypothetical protein n=1 Tax=Spirosoma sp. TaxID=1899569 RepID=UPI00263A3C02|nr:hypothetical protein [Spirosoma sp.]MCX6214610.1 hypothetical protein [Spirosoma sp.]
MKTTGFGKRLLVGVGCLLARTQQADAQAVHHKYRVTQQLCAQLATAFGEHRMPRLTLITNPASQRIAQFVPRPEAELFLDEKLYDICRGFGPDSLAALSIVLAHELTHYYGKHADWFGFAQLMKHQQPSSAQAEQTEVLEAQADIQGVYRAFLAGYDSYRLAKPLYTAIYSAYHLPDRMAGYPSRDERIRMMDDQARKASTLAMAFETGLFFLLKQEYVVAQRCFEFVSDEIPTKELLNNRGLCQLLRAAQVMSPRDIPFRYPVDVETSNRLRPSSQRGDEGNQVDLLKQAIANFQQAIDLDETYTTAYINQASALSILGRTGTAKETIDQLAAVLRQTNVQLPSNARLVRGIALVESGDSNRGLSELEKCQGAYELAYNLEVARQYTRLTTQSAETAVETLAQIASHHTPPTDTRLLSPETGQGDLRLPFAGTTSFDERLSIPQPDLVRIQCRRTADGTRYQIGLAAGRYQVICSQPGGAGRSRLGIKSGDTIQQLIQLYGEPQRRVSANTLTYYCYDTANFFVAIQHQTVKNWFIYTAN